MSAFIVLFLSYKNPKISKILLIAFLARILLLLVNNYIFTLPDGSFDAVKYERYGWEWSVNDQVFFEKFVGPSTFFYSWIIGVVYELTERSVLLIQFISVTTGIGLIYVSWLLTERLFSVKEAKIVAWIMALHPVVLMYSVLTMKEVFISFFLVYSLYHFMAWYVRPDKNISSFIKACLLATIAMFFHGAMVTLLGMFALTYIYINSRKKDLSRIFSALVLILLLLLLIVFWFYDIRLPKLGTIESAIDPYRWMSEMRHRTFGSSSYPEFLVPKEGVDLLWTAPVRLIYFLFSPFIWDISSKTHLLGVVDGLFYMYLIFYIIKNKSRLFKIKGAKIFFIFIFIFIFIFSIGTGNSGTAIRHRAKFLPLILALFSKTVLFSRVKKKYKSQQ